MKVHEKFRRSVNIYKLTDGKCKMDIYIEIYLYLKHYCDNIRKPDSYINQLLFIDNFIDCSPFRYNDKVSISEFNSIGCTFILSEYPDYVLH